MMRSLPLPRRDYDESSSPDPLGNSTTDRLPVATRSQSPPKHTLSSPAKSDRSKKDFQSVTPPRSSQGIEPFPPTPSRTVTEQIISPWKIRVTVEAEHEDGEPAGETMTRTVKVPLRGDSSPMDLTSAPRRGRQSASPSGKSKRNGTPVRRRSGSRSRRQSVTDLNIAPLGDDGDSDEWTGRKKSPRKKRQPRSKRAGSEQSEGVVIDEAQSGVPVPDESVSQKQRQSAGFEIHKDNEPKLPPSQDESSQLVSPELRQIDLNRVSVRPRSQSMRGNGELQKRATESDKIDQRETARPVLKASVNTASIYPTPSLSGSDNNSDDPEMSMEDVQHPETFDTILESEGFTMIDLDSIPSARQYLTTPEEQTAALRAAAQTTANESSTPRSKIQQPQLSMKKPTPIPSYLTMADDESELSSNVPSSPPVPTTTTLTVPSQPFRASDRKATPQTYSSPSLPPPPTQVQKTFSSDESQEPPRKVIRAGAALQDAVRSPVEQQSAASRSDLSQTSSSEQNDFFGGFSSGTKRELRAGLRFGEELARRQKSVPRSSVARHDAAADGDALSSDKVNVSQGPLDVLRAEPVVQNSSSASKSTLQTKEIDESSSRHGAKHALPLLATQSISTRTSSRTTSAQAQTPQTSSIGPDISKLSTISRRQHEWQLEREAISREIESASPSKVIVIDSDSEGESNIARRGGPTRAAVSTTSRGEVGESEAKDSAEEGYNRSSGREARRDARPTDERLALARNDLRNSSTGIPSQISPTPEGSEAADESVMTTEDDEDIWLQEAKENSSSPHNDNLFTQTEQRRQRERAAEVISKPRRSLIPSPWKRGEDVNNDTFMTNGEMSGLLWQTEQPRDSIKFGAGEITRQTLHGRKKHKRQISGELNLEQMLSSPVKLAVAGKKSELLLGESSPAGHEEDEAEAADEDGDVEDSSQAEYSSQEDEERSAAEYSSQNDGDLHHQAMYGSTPLPTQTLPVNFNDSTLSSAPTTKAVTPPQQVYPEASQTSRHTPPRSAMKGTRLSFSPVKEVADPNDLRRVVFSERSLYLNSDGDESSMSAKLDSSMSTPSTVSMDVAVGQEIVDQEEDTEKKDRRESWLKWMWRGKTDESPGSPDESSEVADAERPSTVARMDGPDEVEVEVADEQKEAGVKDEVSEAEWVATKTALPSITVNTNKTHQLRIREAPLQSNVQHSPRNNPPVLQTTNPNSKPRSQPKSTSSSAIPSYLRPPSYPSLPSRSSALPLTTTGPFTNPHFRTLHILHAKSQRPRFHAPKSIRPAIKSLIDRGWSLEVDESDVQTGKGQGGDDNLGVFEFKVRLNEGNVLERFMQEVEFGAYLAEKKKGRERGDGGLRDGSKQGRVKGKESEWATTATAGPVRDGEDSREEKWMDIQRVMASVQWGWTVEFLAEMLGRIVVGEVVRREEG